MFCLLGFNIAYAQSDVKDFPVGTWKVSIAKPSLKYLPPDSFLMEKVVPVFEKCIFIFNPNHQFILQTTVPDIAIQNAHWQYFDKTGVIEIGEWGDDKRKLPLLHKIMVEKNAKGKYVITFTDMGMELELEQQKP